MTLLGFFWFLLAILGAFIIGLLVGRFWEGRLVIDGKPVAGMTHGHHHGADDGHH